MKNKKEVLIYEGKLTSLRRGKQEVKEVNSGYECGIAVNGFSDWQVGDRIEFYDEVYKKRTLKQSNKEMKK